MNIGGGWHEPDIKNITKKRIQKDELGVIGDIELGVRWNEFGLYFKIYSMHGIYEYYIKDIQKIKSLFESKKIKNADELNGQCVIFCIITPSEGKMGFTMPFVRSLFFYPILKDTGELIALK